MNDDLLFSDQDDADAVEDEPRGKPWKMLIIDDEPEVHQITQLTLANFRFEGRGLEYLHAYSADESLPIIKNNPDIALILLDVVMESNHAGLDLVQKIRQQIGNELVRIVLRTGQPGMAPERDIIVDYDINDYVEKTELSAQKLFTVVVASLRAYRDILKLEESRKDILLINQQLSESRKRIQVTLDSIGDGVLTTGANGLVTHMNPVAQKLTGWELHDARGKTVQEVFPIVDASTGETIQNPVEKVMATGEVVYLSNHTTLISKTGKQYQIADSAAPIRDEKGNIHGMVLVFNDVTEQYALREETKRSRRNLQMIMDYTPAVIYAKDREGRYIFINQKFESLFNITSQEIIGRTDTEIFPVEFAKQFQKNDQKVLQTGEVIDAEEKAPVDDNVHYYMSVKFPLFDEDGNIYAVCGISTDITERKKQEEHLRRAQKMEAIGQLTGGVAHDFNNQLGIVIGYLDFLGEFAKTDENANKWVKAATKAVLHCTDLTRQLLSFSRVQSEGSEVLDINVLLQDIKTMLERSITPSIDLQYSLSQEVWACEINAGEFQDAILNLVINARDAMKNGGTLLIETRNQCIDNEQVKAIPNRMAGSYIEVTISDTGSGMDKVTQEKIFEPFYTTKEKGKGTGLGMSMVYGFVERSGGFIKIYSEKNVGTSIRLYLPAANESEVDVRESSDEVESLPVGTETILVVDDEEGLLLLAETLLNELGYKVYTAANAKQALEIFNEHKDIDCLFSDVVMPGGINGYELAEQLSRQNAKLKVLLTSGFTSEAMARNGQAKFSQNLLSKPYRKVDLAKRIRLVLDKKS